MQENNIIFFDGVCNLCNSTVNFVIDRDKKAHLKFAALQDEKSKEILSKYNLSEDLYSIIYLESGKVYERSSAVLRISRKMDGLWPMFYVFIIIPKFIRDGIYNWIAKNRYKWFGKREACRVPEEGLEERFL